MVEQSTQDTDAPEERMFVNADHGGEEWLTRSQARSQLVWARRQLIQSRDDYGPHHTATLDW